MPCVYVCVWLWRSVYASNLSPLPLTHFSNVRKCNKYTSNYELWFTRIRTVPFENGNFYEEFPVSERLLFQSFSISDAFILESTVFTPKMFDSDAFASKFFSSDVFVSDIFGSDAFVLEILLRNFLFQTFLFHNFSIRNVFRPQQQGFNW